MVMTAMLRRLASRRPGSVLLLDGPTGTELERRGYRTRLPLWTATVCVDAPDLLRAIHLDYVAAGADIVTACTFRTSHHTLSKAGYGRDAPGLTQAAVRIAREASDSAGRTLLVAGSMAPLEDCYAPELTPDPRTLADEHQAHADNLAEAGADLLLVETMPTVREAMVAAGAAVSTGLPVVLSLLVRPGALLFDGTRLDAALPELAELPVEIMSVNCGSVATCTESLQLLAATGKPFGAYANAGEPDGSFGQEPEPLDVEAYGEAVMSWVDTGALMVGGCCGTQPAHIANIHERMNARHAVAPSPHGPRPNE